MNNDVTWAIAIVLAVLILCSSVTINNYNANQTAIKAMTLGYTQQAVNGRTPIWVPTEEVQ